MRVTRTRRASAEVARCVAFYAENAGSKIAGDFVEAVRFASQRIGEMPLAGGNRYDYLVPGVKFVHVGRFPFLAFYVVRDGRAIIIRVLHERRNIDAELGGAIS